MNIKDVEILARQKMNEHGLHGWTLKMVRSLSFAGRCWRHKRLLELSIDYMEVYDLHHVMDTILHEIAHALDTTRYKTITMKNGRKKKQQLHHDDVWKAIARSIGCSAMRCVDPNAPKPNREKNARYKGICPNGHETFRQRMGQQTAYTTSCGKCCKGEFRAEYRFDWYDNGKLVYKQQRATTTTPRIQPIPTSIRTIPQPAKAPVRPQPKPKPKQVDEYYWTDTPEGIAALKALLS